ncbi:MAG: sigma-54-dependent Fis family transcriptional regulator [Deltaproteobacteria bacterium]|nr:MAG: sigma-54-dependent Fis family transcriptional regulator [Deltaproteobacteria bacterium]
MRKGKILIVDDEKLVRWSLKEEFQKEGYRADVAGDGAEALAKLNGEEYDLVLLDIRLPDINGIEILQKIKQIGPNVVVMMMTAYGDIETAVQAMKAGAYDYISKPFNIGEIRTRVERALETLCLKKNVSYLRKFQREQLGVDRIIGRSKAMQDLLDLVEKLARSDSNLLLLGESGTGKDLLAHYIHFHSPRAEYPFIEINCAALPETLLESELMGHEKGAFTDARTQKRGLFEEANMGTIFLDEIGDMSLAIQAKVLKLIETKRFRRLGGLKDIESDVRIIAATNKNLETLMKEGKVREDLYYRLKVMSLYLPPLRERKGDIPLLSSYFLRQFCRNQKERRVSFAKESLSHLLNHDWPGNVRELRNVVERAVILNEGEEILPIHLPTEIVEPKVRRRGFELKDLEIPQEGLPLREVEREVIKKALAMTEGNLSKAARILFITRDTLRYRIKKLGIVALTE